MFNNVKEWELETAVGRLEDMISRSRHSIQLDDLPKITNKIKDLEEVIDALAKHINLRILKETPSYNSGIKIKEIIPKEKS